MHTLRTTRTEFNDLISTRWRARLKIFAWTKFVHARRRCTLCQGYIDGDGNVEKTEKCRKQCSLSMGAQHTHIYDFITFITFQEARSFSQQVCCMRKEFSKSAFYAEKSNPIFMTWILSPSPVRIRVTKTVFVLIWLKCTCMFCITSNRVGKSSSTALC